MTPPNAGVTTQADRDWPEDFAHENGNYGHLCVICAGQFLGHKRRGVCKVCHTKATANREAEQAVIAAARRCKHARAEAERLEAESGAYIARQLEALDDVNRADAKLDTAITALDALEQS